MKIGNHDVLIPTGAELDPMASAAVEQPIVAEVSKDDSTSRRYEPSTRECERRARQMENTPATLLQGHRKFTWFKSAKTLPSEYEAFTVGQRSSPLRWLHVGWPLRFEDGSEPFSEASTALRCTDWEAYRDPSQLWQRPYVATTNHEQQAFGRILDAVLTTEVAQGMRADWREQVLGTYLAAWPFVHYSEFLALCYVVREALSDTISFAYAFEASDKMRYSQNLVTAILELGGRCPGFSDEAARPAWESDPILVPLRELLEQVCASRDSMEVVVAIDLLLEPLLGTLVKQDFFALNAASNGDPVTPILIANEQADAKRHLDGALGLARLAIADERHGAANQRQLAAWREQWSMPVDRAAQALQGLFHIEGITVSQPFDASLRRASQVQRAAWASLGM